MAYPKFAARVHSEENLCYPGSYKTIWLKKRNLFRIELGMEVQKPFLDCGGQGRRIISGNIHGISPVQGGEHQGPHQNFPIESLKDNPVPTILILFVLALGLMFPQTILVAD